MCDEMGRVGNRYGFNGMKALTEFGIEYWIEESTWGTWA
jgi:hypothetical protein